MSQNGILKMFSGTSPQLISSIAVSLSAIPDGMQYGWTAPIIPILQLQNSTVPITQSDEPLLETIYLTGGLVGIPLTINLIDRIGRRKSIMLASLINLLGWIIIALASKAWHLHIARFLTGLAGDVAFVTTPIYISEIADQKIRGFLTGLVYIMMLIGILVVYSVAPFVPFYIPSVIAGVLLVLQQGMLWFTPESPYYLLTKGKVTKALRSLNQFKPGLNNEKQLQEIAQAIDENRKNSNFKIKDIFCKKGNRKAVLIAWTLIGSQHFCAFSVILMNLHQILIEAGSVYLNANTTAILFSALMLVAGTVASLYVDKYGRKVLLIGSSVLTGVCLLVISIYFQLKNSGVDVQRVSWIPLVCIMSYALVFKLGLGLVPFVLVSELYSTEVKAVGMSLGDGVYVIFGTLSIEFYHRVGNLWGIHVPFFVFAILAFASGIFCALVVPETKGKSLEEIQVMLKGKSKNRNTKEGIPLNPL